MTLIEVLAGMALMGTLAVSLLVARGNLITQHGQARQRIAAAQAADDLLAQWWRHPTQLPRSSAGAFEDRDDLAWRTRIVADEREDAAAAVRGQIVQLEIFDPRSDLALVTVELLMPGALQDEPTRLDES